MMNAGTNFAANEPNYDLINHNCDQVATAILTAGGVSIEKRFLPNNTYQANK